uniref:Photolyase/cryptochrome alpha/beta domain-containing protein n=1 Tax=Rhodosorus marinus TaxID=101924 RepID=A0A7S2ZCE2_9RHOD|mmetsp:Transcript_13750/g.55099  ORF Transcript_13750/g.55099 Transcript_13750/m.55099 type:complete len:664 (+) Transcript_13750:375-2366(+)
MQPNSRGGYGSRQDSHNIGSNPVNEDELLFFPPEPLGPARTQSSDVPGAGRRTDGTSSGGSHASPLGGMSEPGTGSKGSRRSNRKKRRKVPSSLREVIYGIQGDPQASSNIHVAQEEHETLLKPEFDWPGALYLDLSSPGAPWYRRPSIVLFRKSDLRVDDNLALHAAVRRMTPLLLVLIMEPHEPQDGDSSRDTADFRMSDSLPLDIEIVDGRAPRIVPRDVQRGTNRFVKRTTEIEHAETIDSPLAGSFKSAQKTEVDSLLLGEARQTAPGTGRDLNGDRLVDVWNIQQRSSTERALPVAGPSGENLKPFGSGTRQSAFCNWWMYHSIQSLSEELAALGADLVLRPCRSGLVEEVRALVREVDADAVYFNRSTSARDREKELELSSLLRQSGVACYDYRPDLLVDFDFLLDCTDFETFMSGWRRQLSLAPPQIPRKPLSDPVRCFASHTLYSTPLDEFKLVREDEPGVKGIAAAWGNHVGCDVVQDVLTSFFEVNRKNSPFFDLGMLGPKLSFGEISPRVLYHFMQQTGACSDSVLRSICLREYDDFQKCIARRRARLDAEELLRRRVLNTMADYNAFEALKKGMTGFPVIDASMNQLNQDGWLPLRNEFVLVVFSIVLMRVPWQQVAVLLNSLYVDRKSATVQYRCQLFERMLIPAEKNH